MVAFSKVYKSGVVKTPCAYGYSLRHHYQEEAYRIILLQTLAKDTNIMQANVKAIKQWNKILSRYSGALRLAYGYKHERAAKFTIELDLYQELINDINASGVLDVSLESRTDHLRLRYYSEEKGAIVASLNEYKNNLINLVIKVSNSSDYVLLAMHAIFVMQNDGVGVGALKREAKRLAAKQEEEKSIFSKLLPSSNADLAKAQFKALIDKVIDYKENKLPKIKQKESGHKIETVYYKKPSKPTKPLPKAPPFKTQKQKSLTSNSSLKLAPLSTQKAKSSVHNAASASAKANGQAQKNQAFQQEQAPKAPVSVRVKGFFSPQELVAAIESYAAEKGTKERQVKAVNNGDGSVSVTSSSQQEMIACMKNLAANNKAFVATDPKTNKVIAYSDGDGVLKKPDGTEYTANIIERSSVYKQDFSVPTQEQSSQVETSRMRV